MKPIILKENTYTVNDLKIFRETHRIWEEKDLYHGQLDELYEIMFPHERREVKYPQKVKNFIAHKTRKESQGNWIYFPWNGVFIHTVNEEEYHLLRTNRNRNLITYDEQQILHRAKIGVIGLSVGKEITQNFIQADIASTLCLSDFDILSTCNLNRVRASIADVGLAKIELTSNYLYEVNPYLHINAYPNGLNEETLSKFLQKPSLDIVFEAIDDFSMKVRLRMRAKELGIPVIMLTSLGDNILIDIERYDKDPNLPIFNGLVDKTCEEILTTTLTEKQKIKYAAQLVHISRVPTRALASLFEINKTLAGRPQLCSSVNIAGGLAAYIARNILLGNPIHSGRYYFSFNEIIKLDVSTDTGRELLVEKFNSLFGE